MRGLTESVRRVLTVAAVLCFCAALNVAAGQERERHMISARAGGVNSVVGSVTWQRQGETAWQALTTEHNLRSGDRVRTGVGGRVEILLNPGSYLRLSENSEAELSNTSLDQLRVRLLAGSAIIEAANAPGGNEALLEVVTPHTTVAIVRNGLYRINILAGVNASEVLVYNGRALVGAGIPVRVESSRRVIVGAGQMGGLQVVRFDRNIRDTFDEWSRERGRILLAANRSLSQRYVSTALSTYDAFDASYGQSHGLWFYNRSSNCYVYMPWGRSSSPYGSFGNNLGQWGYSRDRVCRCNARNLPPQGFQPAPGGGGGGVTAPPPVVVNPPNPGDTTPPPDNVLPPRRRARRGDGEDDRDRPRPIDGRERAPRRESADGGERRERRQHSENGERSERSERRERWQRNERPDNTERSERRERGNFNRRSENSERPHREESNSSRYESSRSESAPSRSESAPSEPSRSEPAQSEPARSEPAPADSSPPSPPSPPPDPPQPQTEQREERHIRTP